MRLNKVNLGYIDKINVALLSIVDLLILLTNNLMSFFRYMHRDGEEGVSFIQLK